MRFSIPSILILLLFLSCEEALEYNPLDPDNNPDFVDPETFITVDNLEGTTLDTSTITITFAGNDGVVEYAYKLSDGEWSAWSADTSATFNYIDDGVRGTVLAMEKGVSGSIYHIGDDNEITIDQLTRYVGDLIGFRGEYNNEEIELSKEIQEISATKIRQKLRSKGLLRK